MNDDFVEVKFKEGINEAVIGETLSRIGVSNRKTKTLYPSCYLHKDHGKFYICHFKSLFSLKENSYDDITEEDLIRRNAIIYMLYTWGLIEVDLEDIEPHDVYVFILPHKQKSEWTIKHKIKHWS